MGDSVAPACVNVIPDAADTAFQIHRMKQSAYTAVLRSFCAQSDLLSGAHEKDLLDTLAKLAEVSKDEAYNGQLAKAINCDEMPPRSVSSTDKTPPETTTTSPSANSTVILQAPPQMETLRHADAPPLPLGKKQRPRVKKKYTVEQEQRRLELAHRIGWAAPKTTDDSAAIEAFCAEARISRCTFLKLMNHYKHNTVRKILTPPSSPPAGAAHEYHAATLPEDA